MKKALTFDDVLLVPQKSEIHPSDVLLDIKLSKDIVLKLPIISAAMDTVTESQMAISMARCGGLGIIHKNMTIDDQAREVDIVKRCENGIISNPITITKDKTILDCEKILSKYKISGLPVVDKNNKLEGIITNRDIKYIIDKTIKVLDVMTSKNLIVGNISTTIDDAKKILWKNRIEKLPIVDDNYKLIGLITIKDIDNIIQYPNAAKDKNQRLLVGAAISYSFDSMDRVDKLVESNVDVIVLDSAHGHSKNIINLTKSIKKKYPNIVLIVGNIVTKDAAIDLIAAGCDVLKVGIGPGSICTTRVIAGVGMPQVSAIMEVFEYANTKNIPIIADGGIKYSGDIVKAFAAGASAVMLGSLLAGTTQAPGDEIIYRGRKFKSYVGMGSISAMKRGSFDRYSQDRVLNQKYVPEGIEGKVSYKGDVEDVLYQLSGGIKAGFGYCGVKTIKQLWQNHRFVEITNAGLIESHPHDVEITKESPNYSRGKI